MCFPSQILSETEYKAHEKKSLQQARTAAEDTFHCQTPGCEGWCFVNHDDNVYKCELCGKENCLKCKVRTDTSCLLHGVSSKITVGAQLQVA